MKNQIPWKSNLDANFDKTATLRQFRVILQVLVSILVLGFMASFL